MGYDYFACDICGDITNEMVCKQFDLERLKSIRTCKSCGKFSKQHLNLARDCLRSGICVIETKDKIKRLMFNDYLELEKFFESSTDEQEVAQQIIPENCKFGIFHGNITVHQYDAFLAHQYTPDIKWFETQDDLYNYVRTPVDWSDVTLEETDEFLDYYASEMDSQIDALNKRRTAVLDALSNTRAKKAKIVDTQNQ